MTELRVASEAARDLDAILDYLQHEAGPTTALAYAERFEAAIERIIAFPGHGTPRPALGPDTRIAIVTPYLLIYDYAANDDTAVLLRVLHGKRDITARLLTRRTKD